MILHCLHTYVKTDVDEGTRRKFIVTLTAITPGAELSGEFTAFYVGIFSLFTLILY